MTEENPLLRQFIPEARDLLEQAGRGLLELERCPGSGETALNDVFRAIHTLKGTSGLFEVAPLTRVAHAAEDLLGSLRCGSTALPPDTADLLLKGLDLVGLWVDALDLSGVLPDSAAASAETLVAQLRDSKSSARAEAGATGGTARPEAPPSWLAALNAAEIDECRRVVGDPALIAVEYRPDAHCFFRGEDPSQLLRQIAGLRVLRVEPAEPWAPLDAFDPFACNLVLRAVAASDLPELEHLFRYVQDQMSIVRLPDDWPDDRWMSGASSDDSAAAARLGTLLAGETLDAFCTVVAGQRQLLRAGGPDSAPWAGRLVAAAAALRHALRFAGLEATHGLRLAGAVTASQENGSTTDLFGFVDQLLAGSGVMPPAAQRNAPAEADAGPGLAPPAWDASGDGIAGRAKSGGVTTLRVEQGRIDTLMTLVGELVVAKNGLAYLARKAESGRSGTRELAREIKEQHAQVNRIAEEMQAAVMAVRMTPLSLVFQRFPRLVRDIARRLGKEIDLVVDGETTEADKNVVEALADPLIHMVRNSLDHAFEMPEERRAAGKPAHGTLRLAAEQDNDSVVVRLTDDGRGIEPGLVRRRAVERGLLDAERAAALSDAEAVQLVFAPGFSTAEAVSDLSGRGVGMDAVRGAVEKLGGSVELVSRHGEGTSVTLTLPLSMAVTRIMTIAAGGGRLFGVPMGVIVETVRVPRTAIRRIKDREAFLLRDTVVPLLRLNWLLDLPSGPERAEEPVLVVRLGAERLGLVVDAFREGMEVIVKPMEGALAGLRGFAGTTLLGDGRALLILDLRELV